MDSRDVYYSHGSDDCDDVSSNGQETESPFGGMSYSQNREDDGTLQVDSQNRELTPLIQQDQDTPNIIVHAAESSIDEPHIGLEFKCEEEARRFYNIYAYKTGFSIRKASHYKAKRKNNMVTSYYYVCSKEGHYKSRAQVQGDKGTPQKSMQYSRTGCKAHLRIKMQEDSKWIVTAFEKEHNHNLVTSPSKTRFLRSHRSITSEQKQVIHMLSEQNISTSQIMTFMTAREGGSQNIHFTRKDLNNQVSERNRRLRGVDISSTIDYFHKIQAKDPSFFYAIEVDEEIQHETYFGLTEGREWHTKTLEMSLLLTQLI
uniref:FAR1 domain-containing protein n=1 Tax=Ananas comosus var. bracteatus TaxID=296719 RepID=A0A6V7Q008_ANACO|nr:unnamed protein product [Ananas comosus var. bracteatus]